MQQCSQEYHWDTFHKCLRSKSQYCNNTCSSFMKNNAPIKSQFCTCHDSSAIMACAKMLHDWMIRIKNEIKYNFCKIWITRMSSYTICEIVSWFRSPPTQARQAARVWLKSGSEVWHDYMQFIHLSSWPCGTFWWALSGPKLKYARPVNLVKNIS